MRLFWITLLMISCGGGTKVSNHNDPNSEISEKPIEDISESDFDSIDGSNIPVMITGASLTCASMSKNSLNSTIELSCHFEKNGSIVKAELRPNDFEVVDKEGNNLLNDMVTMDDGSFIIQADFKDATDLKVSLKRMQDVDLDRGENKSFSSAIKVQDILETPEISPIQNTFAPAVADEGNNESEEKDDSIVVEEAIPNTLFTDCNSIGTSGSWVLVKGDPIYNTTDFCVMKYEAKCSLSDGRACSLAEEKEKPLSEATNTPWVDITQKSAANECASLGLGFSLISNEQWMTIGSDVANVASNWSGAAVGSLELKRGHSDSSPAEPCPASMDDSLNVVEGDCSNKTASNDEFIEQRTHTLSTGSVIWDLSGNVWEWTDYLNPMQKPGPLGNLWNQYSNVEGTEALPLIKLVPQVAIDNSWNSLNAIGFYYPGLDGQGGLLSRGGDFDNGIFSGLFSADLGIESGTNYTNIGFRCTYTLPQ